MASPRRSARIAAQLTVTRYLADGAVKEARDDDLPAYRGLTEQQSKQLDKDGARLTNYLVMIRKETPPKTGAMYTIDFFLYIKKHPLILLRAPAVRASAMDMLRNAYYRILASDETTHGQSVTISKLYDEIRAMMRELPKDPLYVAA